MFATISSAVLAVSTCSWFAVPAVLARARASPSRPSPPAPPLAAAPLLRCRTSSRGDAAAPPAAMSLLAAPRHGRGHQQLDGAGRQNARPMHFRYLLHAYCLCSLYAPLPGLLALQLAALIPALG